MAFRIFGRILRYVHRFVKTILKIPPSPPIRQGNFPKVTFARLRPKCVHVCGEPPRAFSHVCACSRWRSGGFLGNADIAASSESADSAFSARSTESLDAPRLFLKLILTKFLLSGINVACLISAYPPTRALRRPAVST